VKDQGRRRRSTDEDEVFDDLPDLPDLKADKVELGPEHDDHEPALFDQEFTLVPSERVQREALPEDMSKEEPVSRRNFKQKTICHILIFYPF
jgi:hypothetical protein